MSSLSEAEFESLLLTNEVQIAAAVLFLYDSVIAVGDEMRLIWGRRLTSATVLFYLNKYLFILDNVLNLITLFQFSDEHCATLVKIALSIQGLPFAVWGAFTALRTYALCRNWFLTSIIVLLHGVSFAVNLARFWRGISGSNVPPFGCIGQDGSTVDEIQLAVIISRTSLIVANCIAMGTTWTMMRRGFTYLNRSGKRTIAGVLLWDGLAYFLILAILDSLHLMFTLISIANFYDNTSSVTAFTSPLTAILVSRFILNLQAADRRLVEGTAASSQELSRPTGNGSSLVFERVIGSLGASITMDDYITEEHSDEDSAVEGDIRAEGVGSTEEEYHDDSV